MRRLLHIFDDHYISIIQKWPRILLPFMRFVSMTGSPVVTVGIGGVLWMFGFFNDNSSFIYYGVIIWNVIGVSTLLKMTVRRHRPATYVPKLWMITPFSFPSGHATGATVAYGVLACALAGMLTTPLNWLIVGVIALWVVSIGISRVYLGAHYPSDVLAGWILGLVGVLIIALLSSL